ncbi:MAG: hypothetical protein Q4A75_09355, partial [Peptostreptococcaceae bacterium]|nr:hypothetical protein [Peptostreptococcaceae bacterium]
SEPIEEVVAEETVVEPAAEITEEVEEVQPDLLEKQEESAAVAEITEAPTDPDKTLVPDDISEQVSEAIAEVEEEVAGPAAELVETDDRTEEVQAEMIEEELPAEIEEVNAETEEVVAEESVVEPAAELAEEDEVEEVKSELLEPQAEEKEGSSASVGQEVAEAQEEQIDSVLEDLIASLEKLDPKETLEREQRGNIVDYSHVFAQANERAVSMDMMQAAYLGHTINYDVSNITDFKSRFSTPFRTEELPRSEDPIRTNEERSEDKAVIDAKVEQKAQEGKETLKAEQIMEPVSIKEEPLVTKGTKDDVSQALPLHINISGLEDADADIIENDGENIIVSIKLSKKKSKMSVEDVKVERQESDDKGPEKALVAEQNISSGMPKFISLPGVPKFVAMPAIETEAPKVIAGIPKFVGLSGMPKFAAPSIKAQESKEELPQENMIESRVETMEELQMKPEVVAETVETVKEAEVKNEAAAVEPIALHPVEGPKVEAIVEELPYEPKVGTASPNFVKITGVPCFMEGPKEEVVIIEEPIDARPIDEEVESVFTIPVEATEPQLDFMTANGLKLPKVAQNKSDMGMTAQYTKEELGVGGSERSQTPGASQEMGIFCNEQEEYYRSQYYFLKTQVDFYERQKGYYQKQLSVSESQLEFYAQQADMYLKQADFYRVKKKED